MSEAPATHCPQCQSTNLKSVRFGNQVATTLDWVVGIAFLLTVGGVFGLAGLVYFALLFFVAVCVVVTLALARWSIPQSSTLVCLDCGAKWPKPSEP